MRSFCSKWVELHLGQVDGDQQQWGGAHQAASHAEAQAGQQILLPELPQIQGMVSS